MDNLYTHEKHKTKIFEKKSMLLGFFFVLFCVVGGYVFLKFLVTPPTFEQKQTIIIPRGYSVQKTLSLLEEKHIIRSADFAKILMKLKKLSVKSGAYLFDSPLSLVDTLERISSADYGDVYIKITIPEGSTNKQIREIILSKQIEGVNEQSLDHQMLGKEGFLFPDTYHFLPMVNSSDIIKKMSETYKEKSQKAFKDKTINKTENELVIMASLITKEAADDLVQKQMISDILWKRIKKGQRLEVDAPFIYESGSDAKISELRKIPSIFNTYLRSGLTPAPIGNPDYDSLYAAAHPKTNPYYFYLHAKDGNIYYGKNYKEHLKNIKMYLR